MVNTYIVAYAEDLNLSFDDLYPYQLPYPYQSWLTIYTPNSQTGGHKTSQVGWEYVTLTDTQGQWASSVVSKYNLVNNTVYAVCGYYYNGSYLNVQSVSESPGVCYYGLVSGVSGDGLYFDGYSLVQSGTLLRLTQQDVIDSGLSYNPWADNYDLSFNGDILEFLYNLGAYLCDSISTTVYNILNFKIGNFTFVHLFTTAGILVYCGWVIAKWVI